MFRIPSIAMANVFGANANQLVALAALLEEGSVTEAAKRVGVTQSAMSGTLSQLRDLLGDPLLVRVGRSMQPTPRAVALREPLQRALAALAEVLETPRTFDPATSEERFAIALDDRADIVVVPELLRRIRADAPGVQVQVHAWGRHDAPPGLATGELDIAVGVFRPLHRHRRNGAATEAAEAGHMIAPLFEVALVTIARRDHPRVGKKLDLDTFCSLDHILVTEEPWATGLIDTLLAKQRRTRNIAVRVPRHISVGWIVSRTDLVATLDDRIAQLQAVAHGLRVLDPPLSVKPAPLSMIWHERTDRDPARQWLREQLRAVGVGCGEASKAWLRRS
jgi:LysR family transcriptional activator of mexEF-oprN operon